MLRALAPRRQWRDCGGRTWKKWTKYILAKKIFLKNVILIKFSKFLPSWGHGPPDPLATGLKAHFQAIYSIIFLKHVYILVFILTLYIPKSRAFVENGAGDYRYSLHSLRPTPLPQCSFVLFCMEYSHIGTQQSEIYCNS